MAKVSLEAKLLEENERLVKRIGELEAENRQFRDLILTLQEHVIDVDGDHWVCALCGERALLEVDTKDFPHAKYCVMHKG